MLFDCQIQVAQLEVSSLEDHLQMSILTALAMPAGPSQVIPIPAGIIRFGLNKETALEHGRRLIELANELPDPKPESDLTIVQNLSGVAKAVEDMENLSKGRKKP